MNDADILLAHPLKHHVYPLATGIQKSGNKLCLLTPFYNKGIGRVISKLPGNVGKLASGYHYPKLKGENIISPFFWQIQKLLSVVTGINEFVSRFDKYTAQLISEKKIRASVLVTMQDYMPLTVFEGKRAGMLIWSDQILNQSLETINRIRHHCILAGINEIVQHNESINDQVLTTANLVTFPSLYTQTGLIGRIPTSATSNKIPYGVDAARFSSQQPRDDGVIRVLARANSVRKGGHLFIDAIASSAQAITALSHGRRIEIIIISALNPALEARLKQCKIPENITVVSKNVPFVEMPSLLASVDLFVAPSLSEGMSMLCIEAMQSGLPLIITPYCGVDCFKPGIMGLEVLDSVESLSSGLVSAFENMDKWKSWGAASMEAASRLEWGSYENAISHVANEISMPN